MVMRENCTQPAMNSGDEKVILLFVEANTKWFKLYREYVL
jgi:hypothetical protein